MIVLDMCWCERQQWSSGAASEEGSSHDVLESDPPIGLTLKKTDSLLDLVSKSLNEDLEPEKKDVVLVSHIDQEDGEEAMVAVGDVDVDNDNNDNDGDDPRGKEKVEADDQEESKPYVKASNFPATLLRIGDWKYKPKQRGDLVVKFYYSKQRIIWEILDQNVMRKIEFSWSGIVDINISFLKNGMGTLDIVLDKKPHFFTEATPLRRKHASWRQTVDFTGGQATVQRRHLIECSGSFLCKNFEKIAQIDSLHCLSRAPPIILDSPYFADVLQAEAFTTVLPQDGQEGTFNRSCQPGLSFSQSTQMHLRHTNVLEFNKKENTPMSIKTLFDTDKSGLYKSACRIQAALPQLLLQPSRLVEGFATGTRYGIVQGSSSNAPYPPCDHVDLAYLQWAHDHLMRGDSLVEERHHDGVLLSQIKALESVIHGASTSESEERLAEFSIAVDGDDRSACSDDEPSGLVARDESVELLYHLPRVSSDPQFLQQQGFPP